MTPYFFGYGSLVNRATHTYPNAHPAQLRGWRRVWVRTAARDVAFLSVEPCRDARIDGLIAAVPQADWAALDAREHGYTRHACGDAVSHPLAMDTKVEHYAVLAENHLHGGDHYILKSYLDVVVEGFLREFGAFGVARFFDTTRGWDLPVLDDRADPRYPRAQALSTSETALVDHHLTRLQGRG